MFPKIHVHAHGWITCSWLLLGTNSHTRVVSVLLRGSHIVLFLVLRNFTLSLLPKCIWSMHILWDRYQNTLQETYIFIYFCFHFERTITVCYCSAEYCFTGTNVNNLGTLHFTSSRGRSMLSLWDRSFSNSNQREHVFSALPTSMCACLPITL